MTSAVLLYGGSFCFLKGEKMLYLFVAIGGMCGAVSRHFLFSLLAEKSLKFPYSTFVVNIIGCFLMGVIVEIFAQKSHLPAEIKLLLTTGFLGAFTTFSTFSLDIVELFNKSSVLSGLSYITLSVVCGVLSLYGAICLVRSL